MTITNPSLTLNFLAESATTTVNSSYIVLHSFVFKNQLLNGLKSSSNSVSFQLSDKCEAIEDILKAAGDIKAVLKDGNTVLFTGYLSDSYRWTVTASGTQAFSITIEDVGSKLLGKTFLTNSVASEHIFDEYINASSTHSIVKEVCDAAGIIMDSNAPTIAVKAVKAVDRNVTCREILETMLFEAGYAYYFTNDGRLSLYEINCTSTSGIPTLDSTDLYIVNGSAISLSKKVKQIRQANINWTSLEYSDDVRVYEDISGQSTTYPHCNISIPVGKSYPDEDGNVAKTEAIDLEKGNELIYIKDVTPDITVVSGQYTSSITQTGAKSIGVLLTNTGTTPVEVRKLQATADICAIKAKNVTIAGETVSSSESKNLYTYDAEYIHDGNSAKKLANLVINYYKYCNYNYTFYSNTVLDSGALVNIVDDTHSGLDTNVLIIGKSYNDINDIVQYTAVAVSPFDLSAVVYTDSTITAPTVIPGQPGVGIDDVLYYYAATATQTEPAAADITSPTIPVLDPLTNKYLWQKAVTYYNNGTTDYNISLISVYGEGEFRLKYSPTNIIQDRRRTDSQTITLEVVVDGYSGTPTISYYFIEEGPDAIVSTTGTTASITIPYDNSHTGLYAQATLTGLDPQIVRIMAVDKTDEYVYFGALSIDTSDYFDSDGNFVPENYSDVDWTDIEALLDTDEQFLNGDSFFNNYKSGSFEDCYIYTYENGVWKPVNYSNFSNSIKSKICANAQKDVLSTIEPGSVTKSDFGYFNNIITGTVTADYVGSKEIELQNGGFIYGGDVDISQPAGHRVGSSNSGFCFDSLGNAEVSNIRVTGESTIEGGSTVLGTLINYDANNIPVFKTVKETEANVTITGSKVNNTSTPAAYLWTSFTNWLKNEILSAATSGTYYTVSSGTIGGMWNGSSITAKSIIGIKYWSSLPAQTETTYRGTAGAGTPETITIYTNPNDYEMIFSKVACHPKTDQSIWGVTGYGELKCSTYLRNGALYQVFMDQGEVEGTGGVGMAYFYNLRVPPHGYIVCEAGTYSGHPWGQWDSDLYLTFTYNEGDTFSTGINFIDAAGSVYSYDSVMPNTSSFGTISQKLTCSGLSINLSLQLSAASTWPVEKYYRFTYTNAPTSSATITASIFSAQSFSYRGVSKTVSSITYSQSYLKVITTDGSVYEFYTAAGKYFPAHSFSFTTLGQSLGAYARSMLPTDDANTHNLGAAGTYDSGVSQRWNNGFFQSIDASAGIISNTINSGWIVPILTANTTLSDDIAVGAMKPYFINSSGTLSLTMPGDSSRQYIIIALNVLVGALVTAGKVPRYIEAAGGSSTSITWTSSSEPYMLVYVLRLS